MRSTDRRLEALERSVAQSGGEPRVTRIVIHGPGIGADGLVEERVRLLDGGPEYVQRVPPDELDVQLEAGAKARGRRHEGQGSDGTPRVTEEEEEPR